MTVLGICGTPRRNGNSQALLDAALAPFTEAGHTAIRFLLSENRILPCIGCETCVDTGFCAIFADDMQKLYEAFEQCDALIVSSPAYYRGVTAQLKAVMDRTFAMRGCNPLAGKPGGAIAVGRGTSGGQAIVLSAIYNYFLSCGVLCVPGELNGVSAVADKPGDILLQPHRLLQARTLGQNVLNYATKLRPQGGNQ